MANTSFRANLSAAAFPFLSENQGRTVVIKQYDQNYIPPVTPKEDADKDVGIPQLYYAHNVMPHQAGYQSIGYSQRIPPVSGLATRFLQTIPVRDTNNSGAAFLGFCENGAVYVSFSPYNSWQFVTSLANTGGKRITYAHVDGETYFYVYKSGCYKFNFATQTVDPVTLTGLVAGDIVAITSAGGYLIAVSEIAVFWSSTVDPLDFTPSISTGAGGGQLQEAKGTIVTAATTLTGFVIYTNANIVAAVASGNTRYPFNFRALAGSGGLADARLVTISENASAQYAYTTAGVTQVSPLEAKVMLPEVTDFISGSVFEDFNDTTNEFEITDLTGTVMQRRLALIASRYLVISYGVSSFTHAIVFDVALRRWGKLKIAHTDCFEFALISTLTEETPKDSIGFLQEDGTVKTVEFSTRYVGSSGVAILGKYQLHRARMTQLNAVSVENIVNGASFALYALPALTGKVFTVVPGYLLEMEATHRKYTFRTVGLNVGLLFKGAFSISSLVLEVSPHGRR